jgi:hypothetical protein
MPAEAKTRTRAFARVIGPFLVIVPGIIVGARARGISVRVFREWGARLDSRRPAAVRRITNRCAPPILVERGGDLDFPIRLVSGASRLALLIALQLYHRAAVGALGALPLMRIGFGALVLIGLWLTFVGWIAKSPIQNTLPHSNGKD